MYFNNTSMEKKMPVYISASRRTDIPRFFSNEFFSAWQKGEISYDGGYGRCYTVSLKQEDVLGYIFWSKDFAPFLDHPLFPALLDKNNAVFHYTVNNCPDLEPNVAPLDNRIETLNRLCGVAGPKRVLWRFDPVCKYRTKSNAVTNNFQSFLDILPRMRKAGITRCYFSFMTLYSKLRKRGVVFEDFTEEERKEIAGAMLAATKGAGMKLYNCCNPDVLKLVPGILQAHCIDDGLLRETDRFGTRSARSSHPSLSLKPTREDCGCFESRDVGSYLQKCGHRCSYCYASPVREVRRNGTTLTPRRK
jgi:Domain of unknown function (DUF1848)